MREPQICCDRKPWCFWSPSNQDQGFRGDPLAQLPCDQGEVDGLVANCVFRHSSTRKCDELSNLGITHLMKIAKIYHVSVYIEIYVCVYGCPNCVVYIYSVCLSTCFIFMCSCICCVHYIRLQHASLLKRPPVSTHPATWPFLDGHGTTRNPSHIPQLFSPVYQPYATAPKWDRRDFNCGALWALGQNGHEKYEKTQKDLGVWVHKRWFDVIWCDLHLLFQALAGKKNWRLQNWGEENCLTRVLMYYWVYILCAAT